jgi:hypothetical protein
MTEDRAKTKYIAEGLQKSVEDQTKEAIFRHPDTVIHTSKATSDNPKNILSNTRVDTTLTSPIAQLHCADAMHDGADKYDPYNWRAKKIAARAYVAAMKRHLDAYMEGEDVAQDSGCKHLGHVMASAAILLDAEAHGTLIDDRLAVDGGKAFNEVRQKVEANIKMRRERRKP